MLDASLCDIQTIAYAALENIKPGFDAIKPSVDIIEPSIDTINPGLNCLKLATERYDSLFDAIQPVFQLACLIENQPDNHNGCCKRTPILSQPIPHHGLLKEVGKQVLYCQ